MTKRRKMKYIFMSLVIIFLVATKPALVEAVDWYERYNIEDEKIQALIKQKEKEQTQVNVEAQKNVFDIIIFMGQSNMVGQGNSTEAVEGIDGAGYEMQFNRTRRSLWIK